MPAPQRQLSRSDIDHHVRDHVFGTAGATQPDVVAARHSAGVELEWLTLYRDIGQRLAVDQVDALFADLTPLPRGSRLTVEPGGQIELSSAVFTDLDRMLADVGTDLFVLDRACAERRIGLIALGADPVRPPRRMLDSPRYSSMEAYFDRDGRAGRTMMCNTASIQVNVGLGSEDETVQRWRLAHAIAPTLIACFANSPFADGGPTGWQSSRLRCWWTLDPSRAAPPHLGDEPVQDWIDYVLASQVMFVRDSRGEHHALGRRLPFGQWLSAGHELGWPTQADLAYHLTTLFPPVRPRGWFELRVFDALPTPFWQVAVAVTHQLMVDPTASDAAGRAVAGTEGLWVDAARLGLGHPLLAQSAQALFAIALASLERRRSDDGITDLVAGYGDRWVARGRTPADDRLDAWYRDATLVPPRESPVPYGRDLLAPAEVERH